MWNVKRPLCREYKDVTVKYFLSICLASWRNILSFFYSQNLKQRNKTLINFTKNKRANQKCDVSEPLLFAFPSSLLKVPINSNPKHFSSFFKTKSKRGSFPGIMYLANNIATTERQSLFHNIYNQYSQTILFVVLLYLPILLTKTVFTKL